MTNRELSASISMDLKNAGYYRKEFFLSVKDCGYSTSISIKIRNPHISKAMIKELLNKYVSYKCDVSGEILAGGNTFLFIDYIDELFDTVISDWIDSADGAWNEREECKRLFDGLYLIYKDDRYSVCQQNTEAHVSLYIHSSKDLAVFMYKFNEFGNIAA